MGWSLGLGRLGRGPWSCRFGLGYGLGSGVGWGYPYYGAAGYYGDNSCYHLRRVWTDWGPRLRWVNVCNTWGYGGYGGWGYNNVGWGGWNW